MAQTNIRTKFITEGGVLPWADGNHLIVLYPFVVSNSEKPERMLGYQGHDGTDYALCSVRK